LGVSSPIWAKPSGYTVSSRRSPEEGKEEIKLTPSSSYAESTFPG